MILSGSGISYLLSVVAQEITNWMLLFWMAILMSFDGILFLGLVIHCLLSCFVNLLQIVFRGSREKVADLKLFTLLIRAQGRNMD